MPRSYELLPLCLEKCMSLGNQWFTYIGELSLYSKIFVKKEEDYTEEER
jgi:hypothetical protein